MKRPSSGLTIDLKQSARRGDNLERSDPTRRCISHRTNAITSALDAKSFCHPTERCQPSLNCKSALGRAGGAKLLLAFGFALGLPQSLRALLVFPPMPCRKWLLLSLQTTPINFELDSTNTTYSTLSDLRIDRTWKKGGKVPRHVQKFKKLELEQVHHLKTLTKKKTSMVMRGLWASR